MLVRVTAGSTRRLSSLLLLGAAFSLVMSCRSPTQIVLNVSTDMPCTDPLAWRGVAVYVGKPGRDVDEVSATLVTRECDANGAVGSLVVVPSGDKDGEVGLRVVAGIEHTPEDCLEHDYDGCIVARRALRFVPHDSLELEVDLTEDCVSLGCDSEHTCSRGECVESRAFEVQQEASTDGGAPNGGVAGTAPAPGSGGAGSGGGNGGASDNAGAGEGGDAPQPTEPGPRNIVRCGSYGVVCKTTGDVCCLTFEADTGKASGACMPAEDCPIDSAVLWCDDETDCAEKREDGHLGVCALAYTPLDGDPYMPTKVASSYCAHATPKETGNAGLALCQNRNTCDGQFPCGSSSGAPNVLPGYFWCQLTFL
jgi:hypothetical protein